MAFFRDLSEYQYDIDCFRSDTKNIGWLEKGHAFKQAAPTQTYLRKLWEYCKISVAQTRGIHECELCSAPDSYIAERDGVKLLLGSAEIRVFSTKSNIFAAPTLIYHYVSVHQYQAPDQFIEAVIAGSSPPSPAYFERLAALRLEWNNTPSPSDKPRFRFRGPG